MTEKKAFREMKFEHAMKLQSRMMELVDELRHDNESEEEDITEEDDDDDDDYYDEDETSPAQEELFLLMELYKVITKDIE